MSAPLQIGRNKAASPDFLFYRPFAVSLHKTNCIFAGETRNGMSRIKRVCVYCASSTDVDKKYFADTAMLGTLLARNGIEVVCGAGNEGLMRQLADSVLEANGTVIGVIPQFMADKGWGHAGLTQVVVTPDIHARKRQMATLADAVVALPGGCGTMEELLEIITWKQLGLFDGMIVVLNTDGYYAPLLAMLEKAIDAKFMKASHRNLWHTAATPQEAVNLILNNPEESYIEPKR